MNKIEITGLTAYEFQNLLEKAVETVLEKSKELQQVPSEYEELTLEQAAAELHCHKATVRRKMLDAGINGVKVGKEIMIQRKDLKKIKRSAR
jgi:excisionase family DNA binding protein